MEIPAFLLCPHICLVWKMEQWRLVFRLRIHHDGQGTKTKFADMFRDEMSDGGRRDANTGRQAFISISVETRIRYVSVSLLSPDWP